MKALFIGLGSIGQRHLRNLKQLRPDCEILSYRVKKSVPLLSKENKIIDNKSLKDHYSILEYSSLTDALSQEPNIIFITNPSKFHVKTALECIHSGAHLFIEKPLSSSMNGINKLIEINKQFNYNKIALGYQYRFHPGIKLLKDKFQNIGNIISTSFVNGEYLPDWHPYEDYRVGYAAKKELGGGALVTQIHDFDMSIDLFGMPKSLFAVGGKLSKLEIDVEDSVKILMSNKYNNKIIPISINLDYLRWPKQRTIEIIGDEGQLMLDLNTNKLYFSDLKSRKEYEIIINNIDRNTLFINEMNNFLNFSEGKENAAVDLENGLNSLRLALAAKESIQTNKAIKFNSYE
jgi:predicted dehydrogenase